MEWNWRDLKSTNYIANRDREKKTTNCVENQERKYPSILRRRGKWAFVPLSFAEWTLFSVAIAYFHLAQSLIFVVVVVVACIIRDARPIHGETLSLAHSLCRSLAQIPSPPTGKQKKTKTRFLQKFIVQKFQSPIYYLYPLELSHFTGLHFSVIIIYSKWIFMRYLLIFKL